MRKYLFCLIITAFAFGISGCSDDQYAIEKQYWRLQKQAENIYKNPHGSPPKELEKVIQLLNNFIGKYPKDKLSLNADFDIAGLYITKEEYEKARAQLQIIINKYNKSRTVSAEALFLLGTTYQKENSWGQALIQYRKIIQDYPDTLKGLEIPLYIARYYKTAYQPDKMHTAYKEAISHYKGLIEKYPNTALAYAAHSAMAKCYIAIKDWEKTIETFNAMLDTYKGKAKMDGILLNMAFIYSKELKNNIKAKEALAQLKNDYPKSRLLKAADKILKEIEKK